MSTSTRRIQPSLRHASSVLGRGVGVELGFGSCLTPSLWDVSLSSPEASAFQGDKGLLKLGGVMSSQVPRTLCPRPLEVEEGCHAAQ